MVGSVCRCFFFLPKTCHFVSFEQRIGNSKHHWPPTMLSSKRKFGDYGLGRRVRARKEEESDVEVESSDAPSEEKVNASESEMSEQGQDSDDGLVEEEEEEV